MLTPALGNRIISYYRIIHHVFCRTATQHHTHGAEQLRFCSGDNYFRIGGRGVKYKSLHSLDKAHTNLCSITWGPVRTFSLIYYVFVTLFCTHAPVIHPSKLCLVSVCKPLRVQ